MQTERSRKHSDFSLETNAGKDLLSAVSIFWESLRSLVEVVGTSILPMVVKGLEMANSVQSP